MKNLIELFYLSILFPVISLKLLIDLKQKKNLAMNDMVFILYNVIIDTLIILY